MPKSRKRKAKQRGDDSDYSGDLSDFAPVRAQPVRKAKLKLEDDVGHIGRLAPRPRPTARKNTENAAPRLNAIKTIPAAGTLQTQSTATVPTEQPAETFSALERTVASIASPVLKNAWKLNRKMVTTRRLHFAFDAVAPYVEYKRGVVFKFDKSFPERGDDTPSELTDSQGKYPVKEWLAYAPRNYLYVPACALTPQSPCELILFVKPSAYILIHCDERIVHVLGARRTAIV